MTGCIYVLLDERYEDGNPRHIRYVGLTKNLKKRIQGHKDGIYKHKNYKNSWLRSLVEAGLNPVNLLVIEDGIKVDSELADAERYWITQFKAWGFRLTNTTSGGDGVLDLPQHIRDGMSEKIRSRMLSLGENHQSKTPKNRKRASEHLKDPNHPVRSEAARKKSGLSRQGMNTGDKNPAKRPEVRKKISNGKKGDKHPSKRPEARIRFGDMMRGKFVGDKNPAKRPEVRLAISSNRKGLSMGPDHPRSKKIRCITTGEVFNCIEDGARWLRTIGFTKTSSGSISQVCSGKLKLCHGYAWEFC